MESQTSKERDRRQQILDAALRVFARNGFHKATIKAIAREAQLKSPALIYWYFESKADLFREVLRSRAPLLIQLTQSDALLDAPPEEGLARFARRYLATFAEPEMLRLYRLIVADTLRQPEENTALLDSGLMDIILFLIRYFRRQIELGRLRPHDPQVSGRAFYGAINAYVMAHALFPSLSEGLADADTYVSQLIHTFLDGLRAEEA